MPWDALYRPLFRSFPTPPQTSGLAHGPPALRTFRRSGLSFPVLYTKWRWDGAWVVMECLHFATCDSLRECCGARDIYTLSALVFSMTEC